MVIVAIYFHGSCQCNEYILFAFLIFLMVFFHLGINAQIKLHAHTVTNVRNVCILHNQMQTPRKANKMKALHILSCQSMMIFTDNEEYNEKLEKEVYI